MAQIDAYLDATHALDLPIGFHLTPHTHHSTPAQKILIQARAQQDILEFVNALDAHLTFQTFLVGQRLSAADVTVGCSLLPLCWHSRLGVIIQSKPSVTRFLNTLLAHPSFQSVFGVDATLGKRG